MQHASPLRRKAENLAATIAWARKARKAGAELVVLPELGVTGHGGHPSMIEEAERVPDGPSCQALIDLAKELGIFICVGIAEVDQGVEYNCQFIVGPDGFVGKQRKIHLSGDEYFYFRHGTDLPVFDLPFAKVGIVICFDNTIPEVARTQAVQGAEVSLAVHAARIGKWPTTLKQKKLTIEKYWLPPLRRMHWSRARDNGCYVCLNNTVGRSAHGIRGVEANHVGGLMVFGPDGELVAENDAIRLREEMLVVPLEAKPVRQARSGSCFNLRVRRPEAFGPLTKTTA